MNHSITVSVGTSNQGINTSGSVWNDVGASCEASYGVGVHNITSSGSGANGDVGKELGSTNETGACSGNMSDVSHVDPDAFPSLVATGSVKQNTVTAGNLHARAPKDIFEAERRLKVFDLSSRWGPAPSSSLTRSERIARGRKLLTPAPAGWDWVDDILRQFPALGCLTAFEQYKPPIRTTESAFESKAPPTRAEQKKAHAPRLASVTREAPRVSVPQKCSNQPLGVAKPGESEGHRKHLFNHTLQNDVGGD